MGDPWRVERIDLAYTDAVQQTREVAGVITAAPPEIMDDAAQICVEGEQPRAGSTPAGGALLSLLAFGVVPPGGAMRRLFVDAVLVALIMSEKSGSASRPRRCLRRNAARLRDASPYGVGRAERRKRITLPRAH
jgi:hypothetical protein